MIKNGTSQYTFIVTAEHASERLPESLKSRLEDYVKGRETHEVFDPGTRTIAEELAQILNCPLLLGEYSRLAIDLNRSIGNPSQFSEIVFDLCETEKARLISETYLPFREETKRKIEEAHNRGETVIHLSIHSFTKVFKGVKRDVDIGILFDDQNPVESKFGKSLVKLLRTVLPEQTIRSNEPYHGSEDGHTTALRKRYPSDRYIGLEIEFSQALELELDAESYATIISKALKALIR